MTLIKGGGGALLREKIVAAASAKMLVIADESKWVSMLGRFPLPVEIAPNGHAFVTDGGHWLLDAQLQRIPDPKTLAARLSAVPGVMEHGLFIGLARTAIVAGPDGVRLIERP